MCQTETYKTSIFLKKTWLRNSNFIWFGSGLCPPKTLAWTVFCNSAMPPTRNSKWERPDFLDSPAVPLSSAGCLPTVLLPAPSPTCSWSSWWVFITAPATLDNQFYASSPFLCVISFLCHLFCGLHLLLQSFFQQLFIKPLVPRNCYLSRGTSVNKQTYKIPVLLKLPSKSMKTMTKFTSLCPCLPSSLPITGAQQKPFLRKS